MNENSLKAHNLSKKISKNRALYEIAVTKANALTGKCLMLSQRQEAFCKRLSKVEKLLQQGELSDDEIIRILVDLLKESADIYSESAEVQSRLSHTYERISWLNGQFNAYKELS